jgi:hypothetical protein
VWFCYRLDRLGVVGTDVRDVDAETLAALPNGVDGPVFEGLDLDGEGLQGVLTRRPIGFAETKAGHATDRERSAA